MRLIQLTLLIVLVIYASTQNSATLENPQWDVQYQELFRPGYHYSPATGWINDPIGLVYYRGTYHMFYQYNPSGTHWGNMTWGHAISIDLVNWQYMPVAIPQYDGIAIYSGSIIIDYNNTSGFCESQQLGCMIAYYTACTGIYQSQAIAYSNDFGVTFEEYDNNPIINLNLTDFRDPHVFWYEPDNKWIMITALSTQFKCQLYYSRDLINWELLSDFGPEGSVTGVWEDPDLFKLTVEGEETEKWVLVHSVRVEHVEYYIGDFDGTTFTNTETAGQKLYVDKGKDYIEAASYNNEPLGRRLQMAWMDEVPYAEELPEQVFRGAMTLIRELKLRRYDEGLRLISEPVEEYKDLRYNNVHYDSIEFIWGQQPYKLTTTGNQLEISLTFVFDQDPTLTPDEVGIKGFVGANQSTIIGYDVDQGLLYIDRSNSGIVDFDSTFVDLASYPLELENNTLTLRVFFDQSSVEVFANNGRVVMTDLIFPDPSQNDFYVYVNAGNVVVQNIDIWQLRSIWPDTTSSNTQENSIEDLILI